MLPLLDILHRGVVYSLAGLTCWTIISSVAVHRETIQKGKGEWCRVTCNIIDQNAVLDVSCKSQ